MFTTIFELKLLVESLNRPAILPCRPVWRPANCPPPHQQGCRRHGRRQGWVDAATRHGVEQERGCGPALVDEGADISAADKHGSTPLRSSALRGTRRWPDCSSTEALSSRPPTSAGQRSYAPRQKTELGGSPATYRRECRCRHLSRRQRRGDAAVCRGTVRARDGCPAAPQSRLSLSPPSSSALIICPNTPPQRVRLIIAPGRERRRRRPRHRL